ncbi:MAG: PHP domain-containing protein [Gammaproteobacteria bacterium]|nr:PHP domain-containing protein [Gammaproteobacteria bacterium]
MGHYDLHCHSNVSDGTLTPTELVRRAAARGVRQLALTDHDTVAGLDEAAAAAAGHGLTLINGVELSTGWKGRTIHLVGLGFDTDATPLRDGLARLAELRAERAERMARSLDRAGIPGALEGARAIARGASLGRTHFARFLWRHLGLRGPGEVYRRYLVHNRPGYVHVEWPAFAEAVAWIRDAGGLPVLAHPARYRLTRTKLRELIETGKEAGLRGIEVAGARGTPAEVRWLGDVARRHGLLASAGSDFHTHEQCWIELGRLRPLPEDLPTVIDAVT